ncbi:MAG: S9 family peptidase [Mucilaginibacter sp.]|nr:S9 family peptidase [Mucilaginibacter sp.]
MRSEKFYVSKSRGNNFNYIRGKILVCSFFVLFTFTSNAQKKALSINARENWPAISFYKDNISQDGGFIFYEVNTGSVKTEKFLQSTNTSWKKNINNNGPVLFAQKGKVAIFHQGIDSLAITILGTDQTTYVTDCDEITPNGIADHWAVFKSHSIADKLFILNLTTGNKVNIDKVADFRAMTNGLIVKDLMGIINYIDLSTNQTKPIDKDIDFGSIKISPDNKAFVCVNYNTAPAKICYFHEGFEHSVEFELSQISRLCPAKSLAFSKDGNKLIFQCTTSSSLVSQSRKTPVPVINAKISLSTLNNSLDNDDLDSEQTRQVILDLVTKEKHLIPIQIGFNLLSVSRDGNWFLYCKSKIVNSQFLSINELMVIDAQKGRMNKLKKFYGVGVYAKLSPNGNYVVFYDPLKSTYYSYNTTTQRQYVISRDIKDSLTYTNDHAGIPNAIFQPVWLDDYESMLLCARNSIWLVNLADKKRAIRLRGDLNCQKLAFLNTSDDDLASISGDIFLSTFDNNTEDAEFYTLKLKPQIQLNVLWKGRERVYFRALGTWALPNTKPPFKPLKADSAHVFFLTRESENQFPNLFLTKNFKEFKQLTDLQPEKEYNWYTTELVKWYGKKNKNLSGLLFKPENFDAKKKYPLIVYCYQQFPGGMHCFSQPEFASGSMNIPWFVSNGYLVFVPNIEFTVGYTGESALNTVVSGVKYLSKYSWVDSKRLGIQGHSFGGTSVYYIISHTSIFTAAAPAEGVTDNVSAYGVANPRMKYFWTIGQGRMGKFLSQDPQAYIRNSPIFSAKKVTTPLFMMGNELDNIVPATQAMEFFFELSALDKKAWLINYKDGEHVLGLPKDQLDYTIRLSQFFGYYLKGEPEPQWMVDGSLSLELTNKML